MTGLTSAEYLAILLSLKVALFATLLSLPIGFAAAYMLAFGRFRGKLIFDVLINAPLTLPPVVVGYLLLVLLGKNGWVGSVLDRVGVNVLFTWKAAVIATSVVGFPLLVRSIRLAMVSIDDRLIATSRSLGAGRLDAVLSIIAPLSLKGVMAGSALMFARSLGEFGATIIVAGNIPGITQTIPLAIYDYAGSPGGDSMALTLCAVSVVISVAVLLVHETLEARLARSS